VYWHVIVDSAFVTKSNLDALVYPQNIVGRNEKTEDLVRILLGYKQGYVVPLISVYGRSGSGKSTIVRFVCQNLSDVSYCFANLRKAKTVFGAANIILGELGQPSLKSAQGLHLAVEKIGETIKSVLQKEKKKLYVLVLDEYDVLFFDKRGNPSDFIYKLVTLEENLREKGYMLCIIAVSNNVLSDYKIDERVRSRIGNSEIFFEPYRKEEVLDILKVRAKETFRRKIDDKVLQKCASLSSEEHGDARRAIDLLRVAAELASSKGEKITESHVETALAMLQKSRIAEVLQNAPFQLKLVFIGIARISYLADQEWSSTVTIYSQYETILPKDVKKLSYRRVSDLLGELEMAGFVVSQTSSKGRQGYGTQYKLTVPPYAVKVIDPKVWQTWEENKAKHYDLVHNPKYKYARDSKNVWERFEGQKNWRKYVGID